MAEELNFLISGVVLGLAARVSPGPLLALLFMNEGIELLALALWHP
jgi:hypothetical protein